jgi:FMN phosphatase YigB (HAD superfamily)
MVTIIFDFDDTLFDTSMLKQGIFMKLAAHGIDNEIIENTYEECKNEKDVYTLRGHTDILKEKHNFLGTDDMHDWFSKLDLSSYLFPEVIEGLEKLSREHHLVLLTKGESEYQNIKLEGAGIKKYFQEIHITSKEKEEFLKDKIYSNPIYFINDKSSENKKIKDKFPEINIIENKKGEMIKIIDLSFE